MTPANETMASTERSMPPVRMTNVCPAATSPSAAASRPMSMRLVGERKAGDMTQSAAAMAISTSAGPAPETTLRANLRDRSTAVAASVIGGHLGQVGVAGAAVRGRGQVHDAFLRRLRA